MKNIMIIGAHSDDLELGCIGTAINQLEKGNKVVMVVMTFSDSERASEQNNSIKIINTSPSLIYWNLSMKDGEARIEKNVIDFVDNAVDVYDIDTIFTHWKHSSHQDHKVAYNLAMIVGRHVKNIYMYEQIAPSHINNPAFMPIKFINITNSINKKIETLKCYKSQIDKYGSEWIEIVKSQSKVRGWQANMKHAEAFEIVKEIDD